MAKKPNPKAETALVNVTYTDGTQTSNRRIPGHLLTSLDSEAEIRAYIEQQDREIGERSGRPRAPVDSIEKIR